MTWPPLPPAAELVAVNWIDESMIVFGGPSPRPADTGLSVHDLPRVSLASPARTDAGEAAEGSNS